MHETEHSREQLRAALTLLHRRVEGLETTQAILAQQNASLPDRMQQLNIDLRQTRQSPRAADPDV